MNINPFSTPPLTTGSVTTSKSGQPDATAVGTTTQEAAPAAPVTAAPVQDQQWLDDVLQKSWDYYKNSMMINQERVLSNNYGGTISEGQSYAMLKAVYMNDRQTFDKIWKWTQENLQQRPGDHLFGWRWGQKPDGTNGLIYADNATDADQDIAYALLQASQKWGDDKYRQDALPIIKDLYNINVVDLHGKKYMSPGDWEGFRYNGMQTLDPSYMEPFVYREFAKADPEHAQGWNDVATNVYPAITAATELTANKLPPNWFGIPFDKDKVVFSDVQGQGARDFGYDAFRVLWRMSVDASKGSPEAKAYLEKYTHLLDTWQTDGKLPEGYAPDGRPLGPANSGFTLSAALAQNHILDPAKDKELFDAMLKPNYNEGSGTFFNTYNDYLQSVIWFGLYALKYPTVENTEGTTAPTQTPPVTTTPSLTPPPTQPATTPPIQPAPSPVPPPSTQPQSNLLQSGITLGVSLNTLQDALLKANPQATTDSRLGSAQLEAAWRQTTNATLKDVLGKLDYYARTSNQTFSLAELQQAMGSRTLITADDINRLAAGKPAVASPSAPQPAVSPPESVGGPFNFESIRSALVKANPDAQVDGTFDSAELQTARNQTSNPLLRELLGKMDYYVRAYNRPITVEELQKLDGGKGLITLEDVDNLPKITQWLF